MTTVNLEAAIVPITIEQGSSVEITFSLTRNGTPFNITGYDLRLQVRDTYSSSSAVINATLANGKLAIIDATNGQFKFVLTPTDTTSIAPSKFIDGTYEAVYDSEIVSPTGVVYKGSKGTFTIKREVTR